LTFATGEAVEADFVILTIPFPVLREVVLDVLLPKRLRRFIRELELGHNEKLIAASASVPGDSPTVRHGGLDRSRLCGGLG